MLKLVKDKLKPTHFDLDQHLEDDPLLWNGHAGEKVPETLRELGPSSSVSFRRLVNPRTCEL
jgi:hypothetical protein